MPSRRARARAVELLARVHVHVLLVLCRRFADEIELVRKQFPSEPFQFLDPRCEH